MTDADGDFLNYTVDVVSLKLQRANGTTVETLPASTRVDFAQYVDLTEFLTAATVPNGNYVAATLRLDYNNAEITVEQNGAPVPAKAVDSNGAALGMVDVSVTLDNRHHLVVSPGRPSLFTLDFNLAASNAVDLTTSPATVTVTPALVASLELVDQKDLRVRGPMVSVDESAGSYVVDVRPFHLRENRFGRVTVHTDSATAYEINGTSYTGAEGLTALDAAGAGITTVALGTLTTADHIFNATQVFAGTSVPGAGIDTVIGDVVARDGDELTVRGGTLVRRGDDARFARGRVKVVLGPGTKVVKGGTSPATLVDTNAVSVGQHIMAFGTATPASSIAANQDEDSRDWTLDASAGRVRMDPTPIYGFVKSLADGGVTLQLESIAGRRVSAFDFSGTGMTGDQDADPTNYEVGTGALDLSGLHEGEPIKVIGFPAPFGSAPVDFTARTLVDFQKLGASMSVTWGREGTLAPFISQAATALVLNLDNEEIGRLHFLRVGPRWIDLGDLPASP
ncbi:MAG TPA: hypothetical protein VFL16_17190, partial [Steroidobacteraceae bacterium]|nr:hypothetical protein [Steroidobacteraceae bacterium]